MFRFYLNNPLLCIIMLALIDNAKLKLTIA